MIDIKSVSWKNFLSTGTQPIHIDFSNATYKMNLCVGKNGSGKSQIMDALSFGLYGCAYRDVSITQLINAINKREMQVDIEIDTNGKKYRIVRGLEPRILEIWQDGTKLDYGPKIKDGQDFIEHRIMKMDYKTFISISVLGANGYVPFMKLGPADRRKMVENLLVLDIFTEMLGVLKTKMAKWDQELHKAKVEIEASQSKIQFASSHLSESKKQYEQELESLGEKEKANEEQLKGIQADLESGEQYIKRLKSELDPVAKEVNRMKEFETIKSQFSREIDKITKELDRLEGNMECPSCKQVLSEAIRNKLRSEKNARLKELQDGHVHLSNLTASMKEKESEHTKLKSQIQEHQNRVVSLQATLTAIRQWLQQTEDSRIQLIEKMQRCTGDDSQLVGLQKELEDNKAKELSVQEEIRYGQMAQEFLKDTGLRARVIKRYLPLFNQLINKHLSSLGLFVQLALDDNFNEKMLAGYREELSYGSFSEGEKFRIDMAILFTWREVARLRSGVATNLIIFDEVLDSSMDLDGMTSLIGMLNRLDDTCTLIVTHKFTDQVKDQFDRVIEFSKRGHWSEMKMVDVGK